MVTFRREMAANATEGLTNYDLFMLKKNQGNLAFDAKDSVCDAFDRQNSGVTDDPYGAYLLSHLEGNGKGQVMTREEYIHYMANQSKSAKKPQKSPKRTAVKPSEDMPKKHLSKGGKIFLSVYVLIVFAVASIIMAVNADQVRRTVQADSLDGASNAATQEVDDNLFRRLFG